MTTPSRTPPPRSLRLWMIGGALSLLGVIAHLAAGIYLITYDDTWTPAQGPQWTLASMRPGEQVAYLIGLYAAPLLLLSGFVTLCIAAVRSYRARTKHPRHSR